MGEASAWSGKATWEGTFTSSRIGTCEVVVRRESMDENDDDFDGGDGDDFDGEGDEEGTRDDFDVI